MRSSVYPSAGALATASVPMIPPAPPWLSTTTCLPRRSESWKAIMRPTTSLLPPGGNGMIMRTGLLGYACAAASVVYTSAAADNARNSIVDFSVCGISPPNSACTQFDQRGRLDVLAEPRRERRLAFADVFDVPFALRHRQVVAGNEDASRPFSPQLPDPLDRRRAERSVVGGFALAREELRAVLRGVPGEDRVALLSLEHEDEMPRGVPGRSVRPESRHAFLLGRDGLQRGPAFQLAYVQLGHRRLAPGLGHRPGELSCADDDSRLAEQDPVERVIVVRMRQDDVGHVRGFQAALRELRDESLPHAEAAHIDQGDVPAAADQRDRAPAQAPVADHPAGKALDQDVDLVAVQLDRLHFFTPPGYRLPGSAWPIFRNPRASPRRTARECCRPRSRPSRQVFPTPRRPAAPWSRQRGSSRRSLGARPRARPGRTSW